jgi:hypothetical protein
MFFTAKDKGEMGSMVYNWPQVRRHLLCALRVLFACGVWSAFEG